MGAIRTYVREAHKAGCRLTRGGLGRFGLRSQGALLGGCMSTTELLTDHYPQVPVKDIHACLRYAADAVNERVASLRQPPARNPAGLMPGRWVSVGQATRGPRRRRKGGLVAGCRCRAGGTGALPVRPDVAGGSGSVAQVEVGPQLRRGHRLAALPGGHVACVVGGHRCQPFSRPAVSDRDSVFHRPPTTVASSARCRSQLGRL